MGLYYDLTTAQIFNLEAAVGMCWTIEKELIKISGQSTLEGAIAALGLNRPQDHFISICSPEGWVRGGAETYVYPFSVQFKSGCSVRMIVKAVIAFSPSRTLDQIIEEWLRRRKLIEAAGVNVPRLVFAGQGLIVEEFIPFSLAEILKDQTLKDDVLFGQVFFYAGVLSKLGFAPIDAFSDLRTDGERVYVIDFGEDLGSAYMAQRESIDLYESAVNWLLATCNERPWPFDMFHEFYNLGKCNSMGAYTPD
jgi:hypothetical protein